MKKTLLLALACILSFVVHAQTPADSTTLVPDDSTFRNITAPTGEWGTDVHAPEMETRNGNGTLGQIYNVKKCGLNYVQTNVKIGQRFTPVGVTQPAPMVIAGIPAGAVIEQAYLWASGSGNGAAQTATILNPVGTTTNFPMTIVGSGPDKCWSYAGSYTYRADITSIISGNGTYNVSGLLTSNVTSGNDMDGAALYIVYSDPCATYQGHVILHDGMVVINGGSTTQVLTGINACANSTLAQAFIYVGDIQFGGATVNLNGAAGAIAWNWWNFMNLPTTITAAQASANYTVTSAGDCFGLCVMGLYYQTTTCVTCGAGPTVSATDPPDVTLCSGGSASFTTTPSGGTPIGYQWYVNTGSGFTPLSNGGSYSGVTTATLTISPALASMNGYQYQCVVDFCGPDVTTDPAILHIGGGVTAICQNITANLSGSSVTILPASLNNGSTVGCGSPTFTASPTTFNCSNLGANNVTLTVTDGAGNTGTCTAVVTVVDVTNPTITCPSNVSVNTNTGCTATGVALGTPVTADNCSVASVTNTAPAAFPLGVTTVTWTVTDASGHTATCTQTVTVTDNVNPTITCPANVSVNTNTGCTATGVALGTPVTADNCSVASVTNNAPAAFPLGVTTVTWTVTDGAGHTATCTQTVTVTDNQNPTITCPANVNVNTNTGCTATGVALGTPTTADNCTVASVTNDAPAVFPLGVTTVTWTVTDGAGHTATCTQTVTVTDNVNPTITCPANVSVNVNTGCTATGVALGTPVTADNCSVASVTNTAPAVFPLGVTTVTWTVTDGAGNTATCTQTVTVTDNVNPTITCPANVSVNTNTGCTATGVALGTPVTADNCSVASVTNNAPAAFPLGVTTVTWTVTDGAGNTATCTQTVTVTDNVNPTITCPANVSVNTNTGCTATGVALGTPTTADNCTVASVTNDAPAIFPLGVTTVTWTVTDGAGHTATCTQTVTVTDNVNPTITCPANVNVNTNPASCTATGVALGTPVTADNCTVASVTNDAPAVFPLGVTTVTWTVTDGAGHTATCTQTVTVTDNQNPTIVCPPNVSTGPDVGGCTATGVALGTPTTADNCTVASVTNDAPAAFPGGNTTVTWTVTDGAGNTATCTQNVSVTDTENPAITCPANVSVNTNTGCTATGVALGTPVATDNCVVASVTNDAPAVFPLGVTTVTWTVTDGAGHTATCTQTVTVTDNQNPTITCPSNVSVNTNTGCTATGVALGTPVTVDNCTVASVTNDAPAVFPLGVTTVTWTVTDGAGNTATCTQTVTVTDNVNPTIVCPPNVSTGPDAGGCTATGVALGTPVTSDNCTVVSVTNNAPAAFPGGNTTVTWTVTDGAGNTATCTQNVSVTDTENPAITCPSNVSVNTNTGCTATGVALGTPLATDNCVVATVTNDAPAAFPLGITTVTWTVTDGAGNTATCTQTVTVTDNVNPTITCPSNVNANTNTGCTATGVTLGAPTTADNCTVASVTNDAPAVFPLGITTVTWTVTDAAGNTATCTQTVTVTDNVNPTIVCPANVSTGPDAGGCTATGVALGTPTTADNCTVASVTNDAPAAFPGGNTTVTWTVTDGAGNTATCTQNVSVTDIENPAITCPSNVSVNTNTGCTATGVALGTPVATDNCVVASVTNDAPAAFPLGITTVTWTVTDGAGNTATCTQTVTVTDAQAPVAICQNITVNLTPAGTVTVAGSAVNNGSTDNCGIASFALSPSTFTCANIGPNNVTLTVIDNAGNTSTCTAIVTVAGTPLAITAPVITPADCFGTPTGDINVTVTGGTATLLFDWSNDGTGDTDDAEDLINVAAGTYTLVVTDATSCTTTQTFTVTEPTALGVSFSVTNASCFGFSDGSVTATVTGGTPFYDYAWSSGSITNVASSLAAGTHTLTVTDDNGCVLTSTVTVGEPAQVIPVITGLAVLCEGQTTTLTATGGGTYVWSTGAITSSINVSPVVNTTYTVTATVSGCTGTASHTVTVSPLPVAVMSGDTLLCPGEVTPFTASGGTSYLWSNGTTVSATSVNEPLEGLFYVIVSNSCGSDTAFTTIVVDHLALSLTITDVSCFGLSDGSVTVTPAMGELPYTYSWSTGSGAPTISGLIAGVYTITVSDAYGCSVIAFASVNQPPPVVAAISGPSVMCTGQTSTLSATGGGTYSWSTGATTSSINVSPAVTTTYTVTVTVGSCANSATQTVTVNPSPNAVITGDMILCPGETSTLTATGGSTYLWSNGGTGTSLGIDNTDAGVIYMVAQNSCGNDTAFVTVINDALTGVDAGLDQTIGIGESVQLTATGGGSGGYTWSPSDGLSCILCANPIATPLQTTTYTVISTNANGCTDSDEVTIVVDETVSLLLPDIFSPNGNGVNDVLLVRGLGIRGMVFRIYDRWGQKVFESLDQSFGWDGTFQGKPLDTGVFVYTLTGTFYTGETFEKKGNITLKR